MTARSFARLQTHDSWSRMRESRLSGSEGGVPRLHHGTCYTGTKVETPDTDKQAPDVLVEVPYPTRTDPQNTATLPIPRTGSAMPSPKRALDILSEELRSAHPDVALS